MSLPDPRTLLSTQDQDRIVDAIREAERRTAGEIRVHIESRCAWLPYYRAQKLLYELGMRQTKARTGVLLYLAVADRKFAIVGDEGIDGRVPPGFWDGVRDRMQAHFGSGDFAAGLLVGIQAAGDALAAHFPRDPYDTNELPDVISFG